MLRVRIGQKWVGGGSGRRPLIAGLEFALRPGEIVALVGPSGCGKTTTLRIIAGLDRDFEGEIVWTGSAEKRIGTVFQEPLLLPWRTVRQNIALVRPPRPDAAAALLDELGLADAIDLYPSALSLGMARRVALARAFAIEPELLLLDEPFVSLDPAIAESSRKLLLQVWRARSCAALLVTHDMAEAASLADRILLLSAAGPTSVARVVEVPEASRRRGLQEGARVARAYLSVSR